MKSKWSCLPVVALLLITTGCWWQKNENEFFDETLNKYRRGAPEPVRGLVLQLRTTRTKFRSDARIALNVSLQNISNKDIPVYIEMNPGVMLGLRVRRRSDRKVVHTTRRPTLVRTAENLAKVSHYVDLPPGYFVGLPVVLEPGVLKPGKYEVIVEYRNNKLSNCLAKKEFTPDELILLGEGAMKTGLWTGQLQSNVVDFEVVEAD